MLQVEGLAAGYSDVPVLHDVEIAVGDGQVVSIVGANGAGKTTLLSAISGLIRPTAGRVVFDGVDLTGAPAHRVVAAGLVMVPEGRKLFPFLTVAENLQLGAYHHAARREHRRTLNEVLEMFPVLAERRDQLAGSLSGGEQQMCALGRGLMARPRLLMLDEPSLGLAPIVVDAMFASIRSFAERGITILLVEQNLVEALEVSSYGYVLEQGRVTTSDDAIALLRDEAVKAAYLGI
ncbi:MAG: ABC transporter ATP-binding protein [Actinomycetia bacterium]|nr:ABC transporter ATP-binding protein [Actinomycetes bacterium]